MPQISKVERDHDIKQVSRLDDLKPATEKTVSKAIPQIRGKPEIQDTSQALTSSMNAAKQASIAAIRHAKTISDSSDKSEDQEAIEKMEASVRNAAADSANAALGAKDALKRQIKKKSPISRIQRILKTELALSAKLTEQSRVQLKQARLLPKQQIRQQRKLLLLRQRLLLQEKLNAWLRNQPSGSRRSSKA